MRCGKLDHSLRTAALTHYPRMLTFLPIEQSRTLRHTAPMSDAPRYRENAAECERLAGRSSDPDNRQGFLRLAHEWRSLAREAERSFGTPSCVDHDDSHKD